MENIHKLSNSEHEVMRILWDNGGSASTSDLLALKNTHGKKWQRQTLNTLLDRLKAKGLVERPRGSVEAKVSEKELRQLQAMEILDHFYGGKLENFFAALVGETNIGTEEAMRLNALIDELRRK